MKTDRRTFLGATAVVAAVATIAPKLTFAADDEACSADLGKISDLDSGDPVLVTAQFRDAAGKQVEEHKYYVRAVKNGNGLDWVVLDAICTHLKCKIKYDSAKHAPPGARGRQDRLHQGGGALPRACVRERGP